MIPDHVPWNKVWQRSQPAPKYPYTTHIQQRMNAYWKKFADGTVLLEGGGKDLLYTPRLSEPELEKFCETYIDVFQEHYATNKADIDYGLYAPPIKKFWIHEAK